VLITFEVEQWVSVVKITVWWN